MHTPEIFGLKYTKRGKDLPTVRDIVYGKNKYALDSTDPAALEVPTSADEWVKFEEAQNQKLRSNRLKMALQQNADDMLRGEQLAAFHAKQMTDQLIMLDSSILNFDTRFQAPHARLWKLFTNSKHHLVRAKSIYQIALNLSQYYTLDDRLLLMDGVMDMCQDWLRAYTNIPSQEFRMRRLLKEAQDYAATFRALVTAYAEDVVDQAAARTAGAKEQELIWRAAQAMAVQKAVEDKAAAAQALVEAEKWVVEARKEALEGIKKGVAIRIAVKIAEDSEAGAERVRRVVEEHNARTDGMAKAALAKKKAERAAATAASRSGGGSSGGGSSGGGSSGGGSSGGGT
jgi:hypothetical protein